MNFLVLFIITTTLIYIIKYLTNLITTYLNSELPGPSLLAKLPLVGHGYLLRPDLVTKIFAMKRKYGGIFRLDIGIVPTVFLCEWDLMLEAVKSGLTNDRSFSKIPTFAQLVRPKDSKGSLSGISVAHGPSWQEQRKFLHFTLNDLGMGRKDTMENIIEQEVEALLKKINSFSESGEVVGMHEFFQYAINSVIWRMATGKKSSQNDQDLLGLMFIMNKFTKSINPEKIINLLQLYSPLFARIYGLLSPQSLLAKRKIFVNTFTKQINNSQPDPNGYFIERYLAEIEKNENKPESSFHKNDGFIHLTGQLADIFVAGTDTTSATLEWLILYMIEYPSIQDKIHESIKEVFGLDGNISLQDTYRLPLVEALIDELARHSPAGALGLSQVTESDIVVGGYKIPKGTQIYYFTPGVHKDEKYFKDAEKFNPFRFIDDNGKFVKDEHVRYFGFGKRKCVGENLARSELFLFFSKMLQKFKFKKVFKDQKLDFTPTPGLLFTTKPFDVIIESR